MPEAFGRWAGIGPRHGIAAFKALADSLTPAQTPAGNAWILTRDEAAFRAAARAAAPARLLPSGDAYFLLQGTRSRPASPRFDRTVAMAEADRPVALYWLA